MLTGDIEDFSGAPNPGFDAGTVRGVLEAAVSHDHVLDGAVANAADAGAMSVHESIVVDEHAVGAAKVVVAIVARDSVVAVRDADLGADGLLHHLDRRWQSL